MHAVPLTVPFLIKILMNLSNKIIIFYSWHLLFTLIQLRSILNSSVGNFQKLCLTFALQLGVIWKKCCLSNLCPKRTSQQSLLLYVQCLQQTAQHNLCDCSTFKVYYLSMFSFKKKIYIYYLSADLDFYLSGLYC